MKSSRRRPPKFAAQTKKYSTEACHYVLDVPNEWKLPENIDQIYHTALLRINDVWCENGLSGPISVGLCSDIFGQCLEPYLCLLDLVRFSPDYNKHRNDGLTMNILTSFKYWTLQPNAPEVDKTLDKATKIKAFQVLIGQNSTSVSEALDDIFKLREEPEIFAVYLRGMLAKTSDYKKVCQVATTLQIFDAFTVEEFLIPLFLLAQANIAEAYLDKATLQRKHCITYLDRIVERNLATVATELGMPQPISSSVTPRTLAKTIVRLCKSYNMSITDTAPRFYYRNANAAIRFLMNRRYKYEDIHTDDFVEFVYELLCAQYELCYVTLPAIAQEYEDLVVFRRLCSRLDIKPHSFKIPMKGHDWYIGHPPVRRTHDHARKLVLPGHVTTSVVDHQGHVDSMLAQLNQYEGVMAFDVEWRPTLLSQSNDSAKPALLQVATDNVVYLVDLVVLANLPNSFQLISNIASTVFCSKNTKLVFGGSSDFQVLSSPMSPFEEALRSSRNVLDLQTVSSRLSSVYPDLLPKIDVLAQKLGDAGLSSLKGLSQLTMQVLGLWLDKTEQCSNWHCRPLRTSQQQYAAVDAYCLLLLYREISSQLSSKHNTSIDSMMRFSISVQNEVAPRRMAGAGDTNEGGYQLTSKSNKPASNSNIPVSNSNKPVSNSKKPAVNSNKPASNSNKPASNSYKAALKASTIPPAIASTDMPVTNKPVGMRHTLEPFQFRCVTDDMLQGLGSLLQRFGVDVKVVLKRSDNDKFLDLALPAGTSGTAGAAGGTLGSHPSLPRVVLTRGKRLFQYYSTRLPADCCYLVQAEKTNEQAYEILKHFRINVPPQCVKRTCQECNCPDYWRVTREIMSCLFHHPVRSADQESAWIPLENGEPSCVNVITWAVRHSPVKVKASTITPQTLESTATFYVCQLCGHVYWPGCDHAIYRPPRPVRLLDSYADDLDPETVAVNGLSLNDSDSDWSN